MTANCSRMTDLSESTFLKLSLLINLIVCICAIPLLLWASWKFWTMKYTKLFHFNFKILVQVHLCGFLLHCIARAIVHSIDLINYTTIDNPCDMIPNIYRCFFLRLLYNIGVWITNTTTTSLVIERWLATKRSVTYEKESMVIGVLLLIVQFFIATIPLVLTYSTFRFDTVMHYCNAAQATLPLVPQLSAFYGISLQVIARIGFHLLYYQNEIRIVRAYSDQNASQLKNKMFHSTLSNRYQLEQNISSINCLKTFTNLSLVFVILQNTSYIVVLFFAYALLPQHFAAFVETFRAFPIYAVVTIITMARNVSQIRKRIENQLDGHLKTSQDHYLDSFKKQIA